MINNMCMECRKFKNGCNGTENQTWTGCIYRETDSDMIERIKSETRRYLKDLGYSDPQMTFLNDIVAIDRPGVVLIKEKKRGKYTGRLSEMYL